MASEHFDVIVVGAGISGIGAGYHLQTRCPDRRYVILESRDAIGGTWDLFRYPGVRSDSDMYTLGYAFRPWTGDMAIADGESILRYVRDTATQHGIDAHIRFGHRVEAAAWSSADARWTVSVGGPDGDRRSFTCNFLFMCSGYYDYATGHAPEFAGRETFAGRIVHPQFWPGDLDHAGQRVVVIGSGATAVTIVPEMAHRARLVTMLQRSPTYVVARPATDRLARWLGKLLPAGLAYRLVRWRNILLGIYFFGLARRKPVRVKDRLLAMVRAALGGDYDVETHFTPRYNPWDQRLCLVPDGDLFAAIREGRARIVTGNIDRFVPEGVMLDTGETLAADIIVTATGLKLQVLGDVTFSVDGAPVDLSQALTYKGMMYSNVPNLAASFGYTNASWTLKVDLTCVYVCRLLDAMRARGMRQATPRVTGDAPAAVPLLDFSSGYVKRAIAAFPKQGDRKPWRLNQNYVLDLLALRLGSIDDEMQFSNPEDAPHAVAAA